MVDVSSCTELALWYKFLSFQMTRMHTQYIYCLWSASCCHVYIYEAEWVDLWSRSAVSDWHHNQTRKSWSLAARFPVRHGYASVRCCLRFTPALMELCLLPSCIKTKKLSCKLAEVKESKLPNLNWRVLEVDFDMSCYTVLGEGYTALQLCSGWITSMWHLLLHGNYLISKGRERDVTAH